MEKPFLKLQSVAEVHARSERIGTLQAEEVALGEALGRTLAQELRAPEDVPGFPRATMDGFAVRSRDTFGASEKHPGYLNQQGAIAMGEVPTLELKSGGCARIATGGMLPKGADAVVMIEQTRQLDETTVEIVRTAPPGSNVLGPTDDAAAGQVLLPPGHRLRPQDLGMMAALGLTAISAFRRPRVGILSSGDEVVPVAQKPRIGQVRDVNSAALAALVREAGGEPVGLGIARDDHKELSEAVARSMSTCDLTLLSGGSSVGTRDLTSEVLLAFPGAELLVHGVSVAPGKPFLWVQRGAHPLLGLPGQVTSCMVAFYLFVEPILERMLGRPARPFSRFGRLAATLTSNAPSSPGRETYLRVRLHRDGDEVRAEPIHGKSGVLRPLVEGQGLLRIPLGSEGLTEGAAVTVLTFPLRSLA